MIIHEELDELEAHDPLQQLFESGSSVEGVTTRGVNWEAIARAKGFPDEKTMFLKLYHEVNISMGKLAETFKVSTTTIRFRLAKCGLSTKGRGGARNVKGLKCVNQVLAKLNMSLEELAKQYPNAFQLSRALDLPPSQVYSALRILQRGGIVFEWAPKPESKSDEDDEIDESEDIVDGVA